jgi:pyridoxamine 5'-phosphate oxidase
MSLVAKLRALWTFGRGVGLGMPEPRDGDDPVELFQRWFGAARQSGLFLPEAMTLATASADARPSARMVLLKQVDDDGFVFFTNYGSRKADDLAANPRAALVFHWGILERQVRIEGVVTRLATERSAAYFATRARGSQLAAWASHQSRPLPERRELEVHHRDVKARFAGQDVPLPPFWGGYLVRPERMEFWQGRADRMHDRWCWTRDAGGGSWTAERLYP